MPEPVDPILGGLSNQTAAQLSFSQRIEAKAASVEAGPKNLLVGFCQSRKQRYAEFWSDPQTTPPAIVAKLGLDKAKALFQLDAELAGFLADKLSRAGVAAGVIADLVPGVPENWIVDASAETVDDFVKPRLT